MQCYWHDSPNVEKAVQDLITLLQRTAYGAVYYNGWHGLASSIVLRAMVENPPPSLMKNFDKIIHIDCSRWKSKRTTKENSRGTKAS